MRHILGGTTQPFINEDGDQLLERVIVDGTCTRGSCLSIHADIHNMILVPSKYSIDNWYVTL